MPAPKQKQPVDKRTPEEIAFQSAANSNYNTCIPMLDAEYIRITHPLTKLDYHVKTDSQAFYDIFAELSSKGLKDKLVSELTSFSELYDAKWSTVLARALSVTASPDGETSASS